MTLHPYHFTDHITGRVYIVPSVDDIAAERKFTKIMKSKHGKDYLHFNPEESEFENENN